FRNTTRPGMPGTPTPTAPPPGEILYLSSTTGGTAGGVSFKDEDIVSYDTGTGTWNLFLDGSDLGLGGTDLSGFSLRPDGSILMSFSTGATLDGLGTVDDSDVVRFYPASLGSSTSGTFQWYFDGSDVGLSRNGEDLDAVSFAPDGQLLFSTTGSVSVPGVSAADEDILAFTPTSLGTGTSGTWELYFDGSDVGLSDSPSEDLAGAWIEPGSGHIYLTAGGTFAVPGVSGDGADIFICEPTSLGANTACSFSMYWDGSTHGFAGEVVDGFVIVR
ncbi:MAG: hypothetical protein ACK2U9_05460, partial [Anaerolineae bacterium]